MDYKTKYIKYKKKYLELKSQIGGVVLPNNKGTNHDVRKKTQGFLDGKSLASLKIVNKDNLKNVNDPKECFKSCECKKLKPTGKIPECEGVCNDYCKLNNRTIRIAVKEWFENKDEAIKKYDHISTWDTSSVTDMKYLFTGNYDYHFRAKRNFNENINDWDVSNVEDMSGMFSYNSEFNQPLNKWDVGNVKDMNRMFKDAYRFNQSLNEWNVRKVKNMKSMFKRSDFNQDISNWEADNVQNIQNLFEATPMPEEYKFIIKPERYPVSNLTSDLLKEHHKSMIKDKNDIRLGDMLISARGWHSKITKLVWNLVQIEKGEPAVIDSYNYLWVAISHADYMRFRVPNPEEQVVPLEVTRDALGMKVDLPWDQELGITNGPESDPESDYYDDY